MLTRKSRIVTSIDLFVRQHLEGAMSPFGRFCCRSRICRARLGPKVFFGLSRGDGFAPAPRRSGGADALEPLRFALNALLRQGTRRRGPAGDELQAWRDASGFVRLPPT